MRRAPPLAIARPLIIPIIIPYRSSHRRQCPVIKNKTPLIRQRDDSELTGCRRGASPNSCPGTGKRSKPPALPPESAHSPSAYVST
jgi:hypothetical protein